MNAIQKRIAELRAEAAAEQQKQEELKRELVRLKKAKGVAREFISRSKNRCFVSKQARRDMLLKMDRILRGESDD